MWRKRVARSLIKNKPPINVGSVVIIIILIVWHFLTLKASK